MFKKGMRTPTHGRKVACVLGLTSFLEEGNNKYAAENASAKLLLDLYVPLVCGNRSYPNRRKLISRKGMFGYTNC